MLGRHFMRTVFLSHSSVDKPFVRRLADFLEQGGEIRAWLDERAIGPGENIVTAIEEGLEADVKLLILSPDSVKSRWVREEWTAVYWDQTNSGVIELATVLHRDCKIPKLLKNKKYFDARANEPDAFRQIKTWVLGLQTKPLAPAFLPERPFFVGRERELLQLKERLSQPGTVVPIYGGPGMGKTTLALEFAHRYRSEFDAVYWISCQRQSLAEIAGDLTAKLGLKLDGDLDTVVKELKLYCGQKRYLLILDNVDDEEPGRVAPGGYASVLITTRHRYLKFLAFHKDISPELFTEEECFDVFQEALGETDRNGVRAKQLFKQLGYLPIGIAVAAGLIRGDVHYTIESLAEKLPPLEKMEYGANNVGLLLTEALAALAPDPRKLISAMAVCAPEGFRLGLAAEVAELAEALDALQELVSRSLAKELDRTSRRYALHPLIRQAAGAEEAVAMRHATAMNRRFENWEKDWRECEADFADLQQAFQWALSTRAQTGHWGLALDLEGQGWLLADRRGRLPEAYEFTDQVARVAEQTGDRNVLQACYGQQAVILKYWGRLDEAMALHRKQEAICEDLGNRGGLQTCYGNQALILQDWGRLDKAMALLEKQEDICEDLGDRDSLQCSYANQSLILKTWGRLDEAMALLKKQEDICEDLGNRNGLQACYGNQSLILQARGSLDEAMALLEKQEDICEDLGNCHHLAVCYWSQADIAIERSECSEARRLVTQALDIFRDLGMRRHINSMTALLAKIDRQCPDQSRSAAT